MTDFEPPNIIDELAARTRGRMDADPAFRRRVFRSVGDDPDILDCLLRRLKDGAVSMEEKRKALETLEDLDLDELAPDALSAMRDVLQAPGYGELHAVAARILAGHGAPATKGPEMTSALMAVAENAAEPEDARRWAVACLATVARSAREVRLTLSRIARGDGPVSVRFEAEHALIFDSSILANWLRAVQEQPLFRSALLHEIADHGVEGFLPHLAPRPGSPVRGSVGSIASAAAGAAIAHIMPAASSSPDVLRPAAAPSPPPPGAVARLRSMAKSQPASKGEASGLTWGLSLLGNGRCRMEISSDSNDPTGVVFQVFETGTAYPQRYGFMGYILMRPDSMQPTRSFGALEWSSDTLPASPSWAFEVVDRDLLSAQELATLRDMPHIVAEADPNAAPLWLQWLAEREPEEEDDDEL